MSRALFGMGCFWGAERKFWTRDGVYTSAVGYAGGITPHPTYEEVCTGLTGHNEVVLVIFDPRQIAYQSLLEVFWESHDPTQGMRQGNDIGTQYRSGIYACDDLQRAAAEASRKAYARALARQDLASSPLKSSTRRCSITPSTTTSSFSPRIPTDTVDWEEPRCAIQ